MITNQSIDKIPPRLAFVLTVQLFSCNCNRHHMKLRISYPVCGPLNYFHCTSWQQQSEDLYALIMLILESAAWSFRQREDFPSLGD